MDNDVADRLLGSVFARPAEPSPLKPLPAHKPTAAIPVGLVDTLYRRAFHFIETEAVNLA